MSSKHAEKGTIAAKAGTSEAKSAPEVADTDSIATADPITGATGENPVKATEQDTPVLIPDSVDKSTENHASAPAPAVMQAPAAPVLAPEVLDKAKELVGAALDTAAKAPEAGEKGKTTTIKVLRSHPKLGAWPGDTTTINAELAKELIEGKFVETAKN